MTDTRTATRTVLLVGAGAGDADAASAPVDVVDASIRPTVVRFGGRLEGSFRGRIVASFPDADSAAMAATDFTDTAAWALPGLSIDTVIVNDRSDTLPSAAAVATGMRALRTVGAAIPLGGAGVGAIVLWKPGDTAAPLEIEAADADTPVPHVAVAEPAVADVAHAQPDHPEPEILEPDLEVDGVLVFAADESHLDAAIDALSRFDDAGLDLPEGLQIYFHPEDAPECEGHTNRAFASHGGEVERIDMCTPHDFTLRHEIAHVWAHENLDAETTQDFLEIRDLEDWKGNSEWALNGSEHAAHIIAWGLADEPFRMSEIADATDLGELGEAFATLTGGDPLHARPTADTSFTAMDLVGDTPAPEPSPIQSMAPSAEPVTPLVLDTESYEAPTAGAALAPADDWHLDAHDDDDDDDDDDEPVTL